MSKCDKKILIEIKNLFFTQWFQKPEHRGAAYHYMMTFFNQRGIIDGDSQNRFFYGKYFTDLCIEEFFFEEREGGKFMNKKMVDIMKADDAFEEK